MTEHEIKKFISTLDLRVENFEDARFMDQKCIPDVVCAVSECILDYVDNGHHDSFTKNDIWHSDYSHELITTSFSKPNLSEDSAKREYDKFFGQPMRLLAYAGVLRKTVINNSNHYTIVNRELLEYISFRERNALVFLNAYLEKLVTDNGLMDYFDVFFRLQNNNSLTILRDKLNHFYWENTAVQGDLEPPRIYNKIINILAYVRQKKGTDTGRVSNGAITLSDIRYNNINWRDKKKDKTITRAEFRESVSRIAEDSTTYLHYSIEKAKRFVKIVESDCSEVHRFVPKYTPTQAHHIFMASDFPELADYPENIICLTPTQHYNMAHPGKTTIIDMDYQIICLLCKLDSIERNYRSGKDDYSLADFINVLNTGLDTDYFKSDMDYEEVKYGIIKQAYYHELLEAR